MNKCKRIRYYLEEPNRDNFDFSKAYILSILDGDDNCFNDYKSRIDKAIEYIKSNICDIDFMKKEYGKHLIDFDVDTTFNDIEKLLNILQGEDNK